MAGSKNSKNSRRSEKSPDSGVAGVALCFLASAAVMAAAVWWFYKTGATLHWGDAEAHLNIARRVVDSRTPGWNQLGTTWLPLPHLLMLPLVKDDWMWRTGLAGAIPSAISMTVAATFLFAALRRIFGSDLAGATGATVFLLNPNTLYLGSIPMTEAVFFASLCGLLFFTVRGLVLGASIAALAGTLTRYEAWLLLPFVAVYIAINGGRRCWYKAALFCVVAGLGPLLWLAHNRWYFGDALYFYRGPWSALAIQGNLPYPGKGNWGQAAQYFLEDGRFVVGLAGLLAGAAGVVLTLAKKALWPVVLLILPPVFYVWGIHSSGNPIFIPSLEPHSWYNTRYAMALLPLIALGMAAIARFGKTAAACALALAMAPVLIHPTEHSITWQEAEHNSAGYREMTKQASDFLRSEMGPHETFFTSYGVTGVYRILSIPIKQTLSGDNDVEFLMASSKPDLFLHEDWAIATGGDTVQSAIDKTWLRGPRYEMLKRIIVKGQPVVEIYRLTPNRTYENSLR
jgi:hypothetical protein